MTLVSTSFTMHRHHIQINMFDVCGYMVTDSGSLYLIHNAQTSQMGARRKGKRAESVLIPPPTPSPPLGIYGFNDFPYIYIYMTQKTKENL